MVHYFFECIWEIIRLNKTKVKRLIDELKYNKINNYKRCAACKKKAYGTWYSQATTHLSTTISVKNKDLKKIFIFVILNDLP